MVINQRGLREKKKHPVNWNKGKRNNLQELNENLQTKHVQTK